MNKEYVCKANIKKAFLNGFTDADKYPEFVQWIAESAERIVNDMPSEQVEPIKSYKNSLLIDRSAHMIAQFKPDNHLVGSTTCDKYTAYYHEDRLYSIHKDGSDIVVLVYAKDPYEAIAKVRGNDDVLFFMETTEPNGKPISVTAITSDSSSKEE